LASAKNTAVSMTQYIQNNFTIHRL